MTYITGSASAFPWNDVHRFGPQEILRAVLAAQWDDIAGVLTVHGMGVFGAAYLRQQLNLPGNTDSGTTLRFRVFKDLVDDLVEDFVVKPATGAGALRTAIVRSPEGYERALALFTGRSDVEVVAESFVDAPEVHIDGVWRNGDLRWSSMSRNHTSPLSAVQGGVLAAHILDRRRYATLFQQAETLARQALANLDAPDCVFHLEAFTEDAGLTFGVDLFDIEISLALGEELTEPLNSGHPDRFYGYILLRRPKNGSLTHQDFERNARFDEIHYSSSPDTPLGPYGRVGQAIVSDRDELKLQQTIEDIVRFNESGGGLVGGGQRS
ncbi:ATP-grasp domain-containing protein [Streptomyces javensis]|uniref:ATP-grasp domain-containing protein n=1 Tax=Streptomyces javensis TaxID=114698 RepID=A0ABP4H9F1_9ACTN